MWLMKMWIVETAKMWLIKILNKIIKNLNDNELISDGYHTFDELYEHRFLLFLALCKSNPKRAWVSRFHSDNTSYPGWFLLGIGKLPGDQITYHMPERYWDFCSKYEKLDIAPNFDGHTSNDVQYRLKRDYC